MGMDMQAYTEAETIDQTFLELVEFVFDEPECESTHPSGEPCTKKAVAIKVPKCGASFYICAVSLAYNLKMIEHPRARCTGCTELASDCWSIRPL